MLVLLCKSYWPGAQKMQSQQRSLFFLLVSCLPWQAFRAAKKCTWKLSLFVFPEVPYKMSVSLKGLSLNWTPEVGDLPGWFRSLKSWSVSIKWGFTVHKYNDKSVKIHFCSWKTIGTKVLFMNSSRAAISFRQKSILAMRSGFFTAICFMGSHFLKVCR